MYISENLPSHSHLIPHPLPSPTTTMSSTQHNQPTNTYNPLSLSTSGEAAMVIIIVLFLFFVITLILFIRAKHYPGIIGVSNTRPHLVFATNNSSPLLHYPLDPSVLKSLPVAVFRSEDFKQQGGLECAVCLSEFSDGENARVLPKCKHGFHVECIDMWFASNSTCPLCRLPVAPPPTGNHLSMDNVEVPIVVTNFDEASSSTNADSSSEKQAKGMLVIEIPENMSEGPSPLNSPLPVENLGSFRKILSRGACDIEQGAAVQLAGEKS